jgi:hypothetical protein
MDNDDDHMLATYRRAWEERGDVLAVAEAIWFCSWMEVPPPTWVIKPMADAFELLNNAGERGRGTPSARQALWWAERDRHFNVERLLREHQEAGRKVSLDQICQEVAALLPEQNVTGRAVLASYRKLETSYRKLEAERRQTPKSPI